MLRRLCGGFWDLSSGNVVVGEYLLMPAWMLVDGGGIEPPASALRTRRSPS
jgi:hypothetical protein